MRCENYHELIVIFRNMSFLGAIFSSFYDFSKDIKNRLPSQPVQTVDKVVRVKTLATFLFLSFHLDIFMI